MPGANSRQLDQRTAEACAVAAQRIRITGVRRPDEGCCVAGTTHQVRGRLYLGSYLRSAGFRLCTEPNL